MVVEDGGGESGIFDVEVEDVEVSVLSERWTLVNKYQNIRYQKGNLEL